MGAFGRLGKILFFLGLFVFVVCQGTIFAAPIFSEDWENGIDSGKWKAWGDPASIVVDGEGWGGSKGFDNNGDGNWHSGVTSYQTFDLRDRPAFEFKAKLFQHSQDWQSVVASFSTTDATSYAGTVAQPAQLIRIVIRTEPSVKYIEYYANGESFQETWVNAEYDNVWMTYRAEINPDDTVSYYRNGTHVWTTTIPLDLTQYTSQAFTIEGRSFNTYQLLDDLVIETQTPVLVSEGFESYVLGAPVVPWKFNSAWGDSGLVKIVNTPVSSGLKSIKVAGQSGWCQGVYLENSIQLSDVNLKFNINIPSGNSAGQIPGTISYDGIRLFFTADLDGTVKVSKNENPTEYFLTGVTADAWHTVELHVDHDNTRARFIISGQSSGIFDYVPNDTGGWESDISLYGNNSSVTNTVYFDEISMVLANYDFGTDTDGDGVPNASDAFPNDPNEWADVDGDGVGDSALVAYYPLDGSGSDLSSNSLNGTVVGAVDLTAVNRNGENNKAIRISGNGAYIRIPASAALNLQTYTVSAWVLKETGTIQDGGVFSYGSNNISHYGYVIHNDTTVRTDNVRHENNYILGNEQVGDYQSFDTSAFDNPAWHYVAITYDGSFKAIWLDGEKVSESAFSGPIDYSVVEDAIIGNNLPGGDEPLNGKLDDVRIYNRALTDVEMHLSLLAGTVDTDGDGSPDILDADDDNDGLPDAWEEKWGMNPLDPSDAAQDPDGDGLSNLEEFQYGKDPTRTSDIIPPTSQINPVPATSALNSLVISGTAEAGSKVEVLNMTGLPTQYLTGATFAAYVKFPESTSWDINTLLADPAYADGVIDGEYLVIDGREFADWQLAPSTNYDIQTIPAGIGLKYIIGSDNSILIVSNSPIPQSYMPLMGFHSAVNSGADQGLYPTSIALTNAERQQLWDAGLHMKVALHTRFLTLPQIGMMLYQDWKGKSLVNNPLANVDVILQPEIGVLNNTGSRVAIGYAGNHSDGLGSQFHSADILQAWWPGYPSTIDGTAEWGFDFDFNNLGENWFTWSVAYGDNSSTQTIKWDGVVHTQHSNIGQDCAYTTTETPLPVSVSLRHDNAWSANFNRFVVVAPADRLEYANLWETPVVGTTPQPITFYVEKGWITDEPVTEAGGAWSSTLDLAEGVNNIRVAVTDAYGNRTVNDYSIEVKTSAPTNIEATDLGVGEVLLSWNNPADIDFNHIKIYRSTVAGQLGTVIADPVTGISSVDDTVAANTTYYYTVRAVDNVGNESINTAQVSLTTGDFDFVAPGAPTGVSAVDANSGGVLDLSWTNPAAGDFSHVTIYRSTASGVLGSLVANNVSGTIWQNTGLTNGVTYYYTLRAIDSYGNVSVDSDQVFATPTVSSGVAPGVVTDVSLTSPGTGGVLDLSWLNPADMDGDFAFVRIYRSMNSGVLGEVVHETSSSSWQDTGLTSGSTYFYTLRGVDLAGNESSDSSQYSATVTDNVAPLAVTGLKINLLAGGVLQLAWNESGSSDAAYYNVYWNNGSGTVDTTPANALASIADPTTTLTTVALTVGTTYQFIVRVEDAVGNEETNTNTVSAVPIADPNAGGVCATIKVPQTGHKVGGNSLTVMADLNCGQLADVQSIALQYKPVASGSWTNIPSVDTNPDITAPYFIHWDVDAGCPAACTYPDGEYLLRAVGTNTNSDADPNPGSITITIDHNNPDSAENNTAGEQSKEEKAYKDAPSSSSMGNEDGETKIEVPALALDGDKKVIIKDVATPPLAPPSDYDDAGNYKDISFKDPQSGLGQGQLNNDKKAQVTLSYKDEDPEDGIVDGTDIHVDDLQVCNDHDNTWTCLNSTVDKANKQVKGLVDKFSTFALMVPPKLVGSSLTMVTVPLYANPNSTASVLAPVNRYGSYTPVWNPATGTWSTHPGIVEPGKSYFVWGNGKAIDVTGTEVPQENFDISLSPGWNMLGNPFRYEVALDQLQVNCGTTTESLQTAATNGWVVGTFFHYVNGSWQTWSVQDGDNLPTWKGLYMLSDQNCTLTVPPTPAE